MSLPTLCIVIPCYNEEEVLHETKSRLSHKIKELISEKLISDQSFACLVDDGSKDTTWKIIESINDQDDTFKGLKLSRNCGHQNALIAGLDYNQDKADVLISIDADLQDDINAMTDMMTAYHDGNEVVYGVRNDRTNDTFFKKGTAVLFYKLMSILGVKIIYNHADYRLASSKVIKALKDYKEVNLFLRGIFPTIGYQSSVVYYKREERFAGESKYPLKKMLSFAWDGITSFSTTPLRLISIAGFFTVLVSLLLIFYSVLQFFRGQTVSGWSSIMVSISLFCSVQLISLGILGEYIGKIYQEIKSRPRYFIDKAL